MAAPQNESGPSLPLVQSKNQNARVQLAEYFFGDQTNFDFKKAMYVAKLFPDILQDIVRYLSEEAIKATRNETNPEIVIKNQLRPYFAYNLLLGKCPQMTGLMYSYFENSSFQPLPEKLFDKGKSDEDPIVYTYPGFSDDLVKQVLLSLIKYLAFNPQWFSSLWNWSELGRFVTLHTNQDIRYLAATCLSIIMKPTRPQHISFMRKTVGKDLIDLQIYYRTIYDNVFKPCIETKTEKRDQYAQAYGLDLSTYDQHICKSTFAKIVNVLLIKRDIEFDDKLTNLYEKVIQNYIPVPSLEDNMSKIAYCISINKPCLIRGTSGSGKTAILDYIAAHTCRLNQPEYIKIQIGDQVDSKLLIGSYVSTEIPGQFEWRPGPLTRAMAHGSWIVFEDIDTAPSDMAQVIHSVIENGNLSAVSSCPIKINKPHPDFRIFFTQRISENKSNNIKLGFGFVERLCDIIDLQELNDSDLKTILEKKYSFKNLTETVINIFRKAQNIMTEAKSSHTARVVSLRDLFKFCTRLCFRRKQLESEKISLSDMETIYLDGVDCFLSSLPKSDILVAAKSLGETINLSGNDVERCLFHRVPEVKDNNTSFRVGRAEMPRKPREIQQVKLSLAHTKQSLQLIEKICLSIKHREPVLLVGETGVGKTSLIQYIAEKLNTRLTIVNLSHQSDSSDLLGDYKPVESKELMTSLNLKLEELFTLTFDSDSNTTFLEHLSSCYASAMQTSNWSLYLKLLCKICLKALDRRITNNVLSQWNDLHSKAMRLSKMLANNKECPMALSFREGSLLEAVRTGGWILLDEVNLAEPEVLQCLILILDSIDSSNLYMSNLGDDEKPIAIHRNFRLFACMNPSTDIGKKDLAVGTRSRFCEMFVDDVTEQSDLRLIVESYVKTCLTPKQIELIVMFYLEIKARKESLSDISGNSPVHSLRTLCRALMICARNVCSNTEKSLFESLRITFLQQLNEASTLSVMQLMERTIYDKKSFASVKDAVIARPKDKHNYVDVQGFWIQTTESTLEDEKYILTDSVKKNLQSLARIVSLSERRLPILVQGNTSVGKTSLIMHMAKLTGNKCYRINNHEHTDLQEYVGRYVFKENGKLTFQDGLLVKAMKRGYWLILDELNLAPSELLEALNRVLDDNRELYIPELKLTLRAHSKFVLFATQNPPEEYAGRKLLSRAFRNRFIELHFDEIPREELEIILAKRCEMPPQYSRKIVSVMKQLQLIRRESGCFTGKSGFMTMRDLFRWGERYAVFKKSFVDNQFLDWEMHIATEGLILLEGRVRTREEADIVKSTIEKVFNKRLDRNVVYQHDYTTSTFPVQFKHVHFSSEFKKLFVQLTRALHYKEPVLLCGQTGCGKTTACQLYAAIKEQSLITYNCHLNTESSDFVGGVRPSRSDDKTNDSGKPTTKQIFPWVDGPLVQAMKYGSIFLLDEISLADDAVLERINSVLEPTRTITLTEKGGEEIFANSDFRLVATMNPGGDYGKKELSPALRNRFTEIFCHNTTDIDELMRMIEAYLAPNLLNPKIAPPLLRLGHKFLSLYYKDHTYISIRDVLNWVSFINKTTQVDKPKPLSLQEAIVNGASLVFFDQFGTCGHKSLVSNADPDMKKNLKTSLKGYVESIFGTSPVYTGKLPAKLEVKNDVVNFLKFYLYVGPKPVNPEQVRREFILDTPIVKMNIMKLVRAIQLDRPILLEGDPGAGKTSAVSALAKLTGHELVRINLSEQTDISDLFGSDLPNLSVQSDEDETPSFSWHDGPMLRAIKNSSWILLDEMNLASQSVLEGLNACFDHRGEIFISELNKKFIINKSTTRVFACQNPYNQGAARKGLPQSFLNRFTSIYIESHSPKDLIAIIESLYPDLPNSLIENMVKFNTIVNETYKYSGFEFNLRDLLHWCELITKCVVSEEYKLFNLYRPDKFVQFVYLDRMRSLQDRQEVSNIFTDVFGCQVYEPPYRDLRVGEHSVFFCRSILARKIRPPPLLADFCILKYQMPYLESIAKSIEHNKMPIIVGESGVGKRSMVRILAGLTGNDLNIICANEEMDTIELLGSFEQRSIQRDIVDLIEESKEMVNSMINTIPERKCPETWTKLFSHIWVILYSASLRDIKKSNGEIMDTYYFNLIRLREIIGKVETMCRSVNFASNCSALCKKVDKLMSRVNFTRNSSNTTGSFEWVDSVLIKSIREGSWLMIENANLMNPATLDRLNSLVELNGSLSLNEKGSDLNGDIETLKPHPDFRLIITMNPEHGELSRAMRNRGTEIFVRTRFYFEDFLMLLDQNGFEPSEHTACMTYCVMKTSCKFHKKVTGEEPAEDGTYLSHFGLNHISKLSHEVRRGQPIDNILFELLVAAYKQRGYVEECSSPDLRDYIMLKLEKLKKKYVVKSDDELYLWKNFRHNLLSLTGGEADISMLDRDIQLFYYNFAPSIEELVLKPDEVIDFGEIVANCIKIKIFLELSSYNDFEHRKRYLRDIYSQNEDLLAITSRHLDILDREHIPWIKKCVPSFKLAPALEWSIDSRNSPDLHYFLLALDYKQVKEHETHQNRWILSLYRIMLSMIVSHIEEQSMTSRDHTSLWLLSEQCRVDKTPKEALIRPIVGVASDLFDLLDGMLKMVSEQSFSDPMVVKMLPKLFWLNYFICRLKRGLTHDELIATCNQLPMLWTLTYQKVIIPVIKECNLSDELYKNKKVSKRIQDICEGLQVNIQKPSHIEKSYYKKIVNSYAATYKVCDTISKDVDKFFNTLIGRYTCHTQSFNLSPDNNSNLDTLMASGLIWSNSKFMQAFYKIQQKLVTVQLAIKNSHNIAVAKERFDQICSDEAMKILTIKQQEYQEHENWLKDEIYRSKCINLNKVRNALDQYTPIWQFKLLLPKLSKLSPNELHDRNNLPSWISNILLFVNGLIMSPSYYGTLIKHIQTLNNRGNSETSVADAGDYLRENLNMYTSYLAEHLNEIIILEHQIVGWTKLRTTTSDLPSLAPIIPEYSPIISLVAGYCLDNNHLKLSSHSESTAQLESMIKYLWRDYTQLKLDCNGDLHDLKLAKNLIHMRSQLEPVEELVGDYKCDPDNCQCLEEYIKRRNSIYSELIATLVPSMNREDLEAFDKAIKLIEFGKYNYLEYAPVFTIDPSVRAREKLEVYKSELSHIKLELHFKNYLYYWKTGENLQLNDIEKEDVSLYPFSMQVFVERRAKLEKSISKLQIEHTKRPKTDDGSRYFELRKEIDVDMSHYTPSIDSLLVELKRYVTSKGEAKVSIFNNLVAKCRMTIRNLEKTISTLRKNYSLYSDLTTNFIVGLSFVHQGMRCLYARLEQKMQINKLGYNCSIKELREDIMRIFSLNNITQGNIESVCDKLQLYPQLNKLCPSDITHKMQSLLLRTVLIQLNHHIIITPSDIPKCFPIVRKICDRFNKAWMKHKEDLERVRRENEEKYQYKTSTTTLGNEITLEKQEFLEICTNFPTYNYVYQKFFEATLTSADLDNLLTERQMSNLDHHFDLSICINICRAHYKFIKEASYNLLGQVKSNNLNENLPSIDLTTTTSLEAQLLYTITRYCIPALDKNFDRASLECHLLQANQLYNILKQKSLDNHQITNISSSIEILDEEIYDIYHDSNAFEALKFQQFLCRLGSKIGDLRHFRTYDNNPCIKLILELIGRISSFLLTDPLMKFVTGSHVLLEKIDDWNRQSIPKSHKLVDESDQLIDLIKVWRKIEIQSWRNTLHRVKRKYIDSTLCDLWFILYRAFNDPIIHIRNLIRELMNCESFVFNQESFKNNFYTGFAAYIRNFLEASTVGDYQIRLDLVFSFAIQMRFASLFEEARPNYSRNPDLTEEERDLVIDFERLMLYVYNAYIQYKGLLEPLKDILSEEEKKLTEKLNTEIIIVNWQGRNLWDIKNNFRISHSKLNKVMNKYKEILSRPSPGLRPASCTVKAESLVDKSEPISDSQKADVTLVSIQLLIDNIEPHKIIGRLPESLASLNSAPKVIKIMKNLHKQLSKSMSNRFVSNLKTIEENLTYNSEAIHNFNNHKVETVTIMPKDTKEQIEEKQKLCRQMYHSKKYLLQSIFKNLNGLGVRYQRGLNSQSQYESSILQLEPLRGMIQKQSQSVLKAATKLIDDALINSCNEQYLRLVTNNMFMHAQEKNIAITNEDCQRMHGYSFDLVLDAVKQMKVSAYIYRFLIDLQAPTIRLQKLQEKLSSPDQADKEKRIIVYNFQRVNSSVCLFNDLVSRAYLAITRLVELCKCYRPLDMAKVEEENSAGLTSESSELTLMINEIDESNSLMTTEQVERFKSNLDDARKNICQVSYCLRDMLNNTNRNYLYSDDDIDTVTRLYKQFSRAFSRLIPLKSDKTPNIQIGTVLGSLRSLLEETEQILKPKLSKEYFLFGNDNQAMGIGTVDLPSHQSVKRLNLRLRNLLRQIKLAMQEIYKDELSHLEVEASNGFLSEKEKRKLLPFNYIDSVHMKNLMRLDKVAQHMGDCFMTLNISKESFDIQPIVASITPILFLYSQEISSYLNIIMSSVKIKLENSNLLVAFFTDLKVKGFGLPNKMLPDEGSGEQQKNSSTGDNTGFGEGTGDTDVSKKLEYESQLDDLQKDDQNSNDKDQEEPIEANDDGVEMSTDLDTKAEGADRHQNGDEQKQDEKDEEAEDDDQHDLSQLDKELDSVDEDEGHLDQKLWDDKDEELEEDDKEDLREAQGDSKVQPEKETTEMQAKDDQLDDAKESDKKELESKDNECEKPEESSNQPQSATDKSNLVESEENPEIEEEEAEDNFVDACENPENLDLSEEADLAQKEAEQNMIDDKEGNCPEPEDMSIESLDLEAISDTVSIDLDVESKPQEEEGSQKDRNENSENIIDEDDLHDQLEAGVKDETPLTKEPISDQNQESLRQSTAALASQSGKGSDAAPMTEMKEKIGPSTVYYIYPQDENQDLEYDETHEQQEQQQESIDFHETEEQKQMPGNSAGPQQNQDKPCSGDESRKEEAENRKDVQKETEKEKVESEKLNSKRTMSIEEEIRDMKRQKISGDRKNDAATNEKEVSKSKTSGPVKHADKDTKELHQVIDLVSSDDEDTERLKDQIEVENPPERQEDMMNSKILEQIDNELKKRSATQEHDSLDTDRLTNLWIECTRQTGHLVHELCQQLQIVLQPTKMSKYKGDYKTGKRLNMRKIISYIASYYMKDKIWLRRTKPSKRTYNIMIAVDNSSSMHENNCRQMTYQSVALLAKSLSLIEAGSLSVVKFGKEFRCIHEFGQPYMDANGAQWLRELRFDDTRTSYSSLLKDSCDSFARQSSESSSGSGAVSQLLIIISDGRNVSSEEHIVKMYLKQLRSMKVLTLFIIIDDLNRNEGKSIVDVMRTLGVGTNLKMVSYMELFPFPFYVILRRLDSMPSVLGNALRQWFELVSSGSG